MSARMKVTGLVLLGLGVVVVAATMLLHGANVTVLNPLGLVATKQRDLIVLATLLGLIVVIPVFILTFTIAWKYRAGNKKAKYAPNWDHNKKLEFTWWAIPFALIFVLSVITWTSSHELDPYKPLEASAKPITIQVVALQWKWLFIYPEQHIATVNFIQFPEKTPINFEITADAPMNSFWIPQLGGQVYAMSGMTTKLHLMADGVGTYSGSSANLSGQGFAGMKFLAQSSTQASFDDWVRAAKQSPNSLTLDEYKNLSAPSQNNPTTSYAPVEAGLYEKVVNKFMLPDNTGHVHAHSGSH